jgi:2-polyprenyl-6-methoxyphenol hydroxylase-like FAD-dependent oxidoreductase
MDKPDKWALFNHLPAPTYTKGSLCILGDAAHATTPHLGQWFQFHQINPKPEVLVPGV